MKSNGEPIRVRLTAVYEYTPELRLYPGCHTVEEAIGVDAANPHELIDAALDSDQLKYTFEVFDD